MMSLHWVAVNHSGEHTSNLIHSPSSATKGSILEEKAKQAKHSSVAPGHHS